MPNYCVWIDGIWSIINCIIYKFNCKLHMWICISRRLPPINNNTECLFYYQQEQKLFWRHALFHFRLSVNSDRALKWYICTLLSQCRIWHFFVITVFWAMLCPVIFNQGCISLTMSVNLNWYERFFYFLNRKFFFDCPLNATKS